MSLGIFCLATENLLSGFNSASCSSLAGKVPNVSLGLVWANLCPLLNVGVIHGPESGFVLGRFDDPKHTLTS